MKNLMRVVLITLITGVSLTSCDLSVKDSIEPVSSNDLLKLSESAAQSKTNGNDDDDDGTPPSPN